jgi:hypothetical protein
VFRLALGGEDGEADPRTRRHGLPVGPWISSSGAAAGNNFVQLTSSNNLVNVLQMIEHLVLCWSTGPRATHTRVGEEPVTARSVQRGMLQFRVLITC